MAILPAANTIAAICGAWHHGPSLDDAPRHQVGGDKRLRVLLDFGTIDARLAWLDPIELAVVVLEALDALDADSALGPATRAVGGGGPTIAVTLKGIRTCPGGIRFQLESEALPPSSGGGTKGVPV